MLSSSLMLQSVPLSVWKSYSEQFSLNTTIQLSYTVYVQKEPNPPRLAPRILSQQDTSVNQASRIYNLRSAIKALIDAAG